MKIVLIPHLPTLYGRRYNIAKSFVDQGHEVHFIIWDMPYPVSTQNLKRNLKMSMKADTFQQDGITIHKVRRLPLIWPVINGLLFKSQIKQLYKQVNANVIFSQGYTNETTTPKNLPLVYDLNDDHVAFANTYGSKSYKIMFRILGVRGAIKSQCKRAKLVTVVSEPLLKYATQLNDNTIKVPNGVDFPEEGLYQEKGKKHSLLYVSTFGIWAQGVLVVDTINEMRVNIPDIHLDMVGSGTEAERIKNRIQELGIEKWVNFRGKIDDRKKIYELISNADVCLNISEKNSFRDAASPIKVIEYTALGKKIISTNLNEIKLLNFPNITLIDEIGIGALRQKIIESFEDYRDYSSVKVLAQEYDWMKLAERIIQKYEEL